MNTPFFYRNADDARQKRFCDQASLRMTASSGGERTTIAANKMLAFALVKCGGATQIFQDGESSSDPLRAALSLKSGQMFGGHPSPYLTHPGTECSRGQLLRKNGQHQIKERTIRLRENLFRLRGKRVNGMGFSETGLRPYLANQPITLKTQEMRSDCIVSQLQFGSQIVDRVLTTA